MVATIGQMASAEYYLESQRSYRHPNEYYTAGEEPDGTWFNPNGLFGLKDGAKVDTGEFQRLYNGFAPNGAGKLVQRAGNPSRSPGVDMTFSVDKSISALWAIAEPEMRAQIESMAVDAARAALKDTVLRHCSYTRVSENGATRPVPADLMGATFVHGTSRRPDMVEAAANAAAGLMGREAVGTAIERLRRNPEIERLEPRKPTAESRAGMAHTEVYSTRHNLGLEQAVKDMAGTMAADTGHGLPAQAVEEKVHTLLEQGYPLSQEQSLAIRFATARGGRVAVIEGAAGSGKTTTLRPITDLHREHGYEIVPTAVAWRTAVALGDDCDARPYCVDKLLKLAAKGQVEIGKRTLIVVDEAGMLSTRQAHHILQLSERHGAKVVFAGDTRQQQPVEAGPGLRLIRDVAGSVRVDRIRRQKADLEDVLIHVHGETPEAARFRAGLTAPKERDAIVADYEAMKEKPPFTPWQVSASEALRDGDAVSAIEAWRLRGRFHLCHDEEKTLTRLVEDWTQHVRAEPDISTAVLARTRAEARALSWLMRERVLAQTPGVKRAVIEVSRDLDGRVTEPLEIAVGDRLRIGATQWEKQLFNGTVVTVEDLEVLRAEGRAPKQRPIEEEKFGARDPEPEQPSVLVTARTDDGRRVKFRHDEIRDYKDNIRLDYGYAMTIASAQGLTVDRAFLLADDRPARETIYPAATRHREGLDIYVNRAPLAFDIADRRPEDQAERPVTDSDIRGHLAERWSRSQPKEAALDYTADGAWRERQDDPRRHVGVFGDGREETPEVRAAVNDNAFGRIAGEIRHAVIGWRHGAAVDAFAAERSEVLAAWGELRERTRAEGGTVALTTAFRKTLERHAALLKRASSFRTRPRTYERLLEERAGIAKQDLDEFKALHARAGKYRRVTMLKTAHALREEKARKQGEGRAHPTPSQQHVVVETMPRTTPATAVIQPETPAQTQPDSAEAARQDAREAYEALNRDWDRHLVRADRAGIHAIYVDGCERFRAHMEALADNPDLDPALQGRVSRVLAIIGEETALRLEVEDYLAAVEGKIAYRENVLEVVAVDLRNEVADHHGYSEWRAEVERLVETGQRILADREAYGDHLEGVPAGGERMEWALEEIRETLARDNKHLVESRESQRKREQVEKQGQTKKQFRKTAKRKRKGLYQSRGLRM